MNSSEAVGIAVARYPFPAEPAATEYCVFPSHLEEDGLVLFHATPIENLEVILKHGFKIPDPTGDNGLPSTSFARRSNAALTHAMIRRKSLAQDYCIIAVRYETLNRKGLRENLSDIHDFTLDPQPQIVGYCIVPGSYKHI